MNGVQRLIFISSVYLWLQMYVLATPGRLVDHLENTKGFSLRALKYLVRTLKSARLLKRDCLCRFLTVSSECLLFI